LEKQYLKQFLDVGKIKDENISYNSEKLKIEKIIKPIIDNVLIKTMGIIKNNILGKEIEKRKELELKKLENMELNNKIMQNILESKEETNMFGYNINNSDELRKYIKEYHNNLNTYIENCEKNIKPSLMLSYNNKIIKMLDKEKYTFKIYNTTKGRKIIIPSNSIQNIDNNNIETYIDDFFKNQDEKYVIKEKMKKTSLFLYYYLKETKLESLNFKTIYKNIRRCLVIDILNNYFIKKKL